MFNTEHMYMYEINNFQFHLYACKIRFLTPGSVTILTRVIRCRLKTQMCPTRFANKPHDFQSWLISSLVAVAKYKNNNQQTFKGWTILGY